MTEPPPAKVEGISGLERLRRTVRCFLTEVGGFKPDFWKMVSLVLAVSPSPINFGVFIFISIIYMYLNSVAFVSSSENVTQLHEDLKIG